MNYGLFIYQYLPLFLFIVWIIIPLILGVIKLRKQKQPFMYKCLWFMVILFTSYVGLICCILFHRKNNE